MDRSSGGPSSCRAEWSSNGITSFFSIWYLNPAPTRHDAVPEHRRRTMTKPRPSVILALLVLSVLARLVPYGLSHLGVSIEHIRSTHGTSLRSCRSVSSAEPSTRGRDWSTRSRLPRSCLATWGSGPSRDESIGRCIRISRWSMWQSRWWLPRDLHFGVSRHGAGWLAWGSSHPSGSLR